MLDKIYVRLFRPRYCSVCGKRLIEKITPSKYDPVTGYIKELTFDLSCNGHTGYIYTEKPPRNYSITREEWDANRS